MCAIHDDRPGPLVGRERELERLRRWLANGDGSMYLWGSPGIGKTTLLRAFASGLEEPQFVWIDLAEGATEAPEVNPAADLIVIDGLDSETELLAALSLTLEHYRGARLLLAGRCAPPPSRAGLSLMKLDSLPQDEAIQLSRLAGSEDETANRMLADWSEGNPLLIEVTCRVLAGSDFKHHVYLPGVADALASLNAPGAVASLLVDSLSAHGDLDAGVSAWLTPSLLSSERALESVTTALVHAGRGMLAAEVLERHLESLPASSTVDDRVSAREKLAKQYLALGRAGAAVRLLEAARSESFPTTPLSTLSNLGAAYQATGRPSSAIEVLEEVAAAYERTPDSSSQDLLATLANLATAYRGVGRAVDAVALSERLLEASVREYGVSHPETLQARAALAAAYRGIGDLPQALTLLVGTASDAAAVLGSEHPLTLSVNGNLASVYRQVGDPGRAIALLSDNLASCERVLGNEHPDTIAARGNLATALEEAGDYETALQLYESVVASYTALLGAWHPDTIAARNNLASLHWSIGDLDRAITQLESLREDASRALGDGHLDTLIIENNLGAAYFVDGRFTQAEALFEHLVDIYGGASFAESELLLAEHNLATVRIKLGRLDEAITMLQSVVRGREILLGEGHADTRASRTRLSEALMARGG